MEPGDGTAWAQVKHMFLCLSTWERAEMLADPEVAEAIGKASDPERVKWSKRDAETLPELTADKSRGRKAPKRPFWLRAVEAVDLGKKGTDIVVGDWLKDASECDDGELVLVGLRYPEKRYAMTRVKAGAEAKLWREVRPDIEVPHLEVVETFTGWSDVADWLKRELGDGWKAA